MGGEATRNMKNSLQIKQTVYGYILLDIYWHSCLYAYLFVV